MSIKLKLGNTIIVDDIEYTITEIDARKKYETVIIGSGFEGEQISTNKVYNTLVIEASSEKEIP